MKLQFLNNHYHALFQEQMCVGLPFQVILITRESEKVPITVVYCILCIVFLSVGRAPVL